MGIKNQPYRNNVIIGPIKPRHVALKKKIARRLS